MVFHDFYGKIITCGTVTDNSMRQISQGKWYFISKSQNKILFCLKRKVFWAVILFSWLFNRFYSSIFKYCNAQKSHCKNSLFVFLMQNNFFGMKYDSDVFLTGFVRFILECCSKNKLMFILWSFQKSTRNIIQVHLIILVRTK